MRASEGLQGFGLASNRNKVPFACDPMTWFGKPEQRTQGIDTGPWIAGWQRKGGIRRLSEAVVSAAPQPIPTPPGETCHRHLPHRGQPTGVRRGNGFGRDTWRGPPGDRRVYQEEAVSPSPHPPAGDGAPPPVSQTPTKPMPSPRRHICSGGERRPFAAGQHPSRDLWKLCQHRRPPELPGDPRGTGPKGPVAVQLHLDLPRGRGLPPSSPSCALLPCRAPHPPR